MNASHPMIRKLVTFALTGLASCFATMPAHAVDCANPPGFAERKACAIAAQGLEPLRQYIERTRIVHGFYLPDFKNALPAADLAQLEKEKVELVRNDKR